MSSQLSTKGIFLNIIKTEWQYKDCHADGGVNGKVIIESLPNGQKGVVATFLKKEGINVNSVDEMGLAPLHYVCKKGYRDIVKQLISKEADVNIISNQSVTPLHMAAVSGNKEIIKLLADAGADINATDKQGRTALVYAIEAKRQKQQNIYKYWGRRNNYG